MPELRLTVIGPGPAYTRRRGRTSSCYLVEGGGTAIVLDLGQGSFAALGARREPRTLDAIFISHLHPDHHIDLVALRHYLKSGCPTATTVPLHAPGDIRARYDVLNGEIGCLDALPGPPLVAGRRQVGALVVQAERVTHTDSSYGFRVTLGDGGPGLGYSGDCGRMAPLPATEAATGARDGGASRLILTHVLDEGRPVASLRAAQRVFDGPVQLAAPGLEVVVGA